MIRLFDLWAMQGAGWPSFLYTVVYHLGWIIHAAFVGYVVGGTMWVAVAEWRRHPETGASSNGRLSTSIEPRMILIDWLPAMLSGAITAGVVPLLFVQILYQTDFYTANLLLFHRWMSILPVLIIGFYSLYLLRSDLSGSRHPLRRKLISLVPMIAVLYTGYSFVENHLLSLRGMQVWVELYESGKTIYFEPYLPLRALYFLCVMSSVLFVALGWQLEYRARRSRIPLDDTPVILAKLGLGAAVLTSIAGALFILSVRANIPDALKSYLLIFAVAIALVLQCWVTILAGRDRLQRSALWAGSVGVAVMLVLTSLLREDLRAAALGERILIHTVQHFAALQKGGFPLFVVFAMLNTVLIAGCFILVRRSTSRHY